MNGGPWSGLEQEPAVHLLHVVIWRALRSGLPDADPDLVWELGDRLALATELLRYARPAGVWPEVLDSAVAGARDAGSPLAVLLAELEDADRILAVEQSEEANAVIGRFAGAVRGVARPEDIVAFEADSRAWIVAPNASSADVQALASRLASALDDAEPWRGAPLRANVGVAVLGADGDSSGSLIEVAEQHALAAAASGITIVRR
jgi:GGDEF domain-containing protein